MCSRGCLRDRKKVIGTQSTQVIASNDTATTEFVDLSASNPGAGGGSLQSRQSSASSSGPPSPVKPGKERFEALPALAYIPADQRPDVFRDKLRACGSYVFNFRGPSTDVDDEAKQAKLETLTEIASHVELVTTDAIMHESVVMATANVFRGLEVRETEPQAFWDPEQGEPRLEPSWPHLQLVYEFLMRLVAMEVPCASTARRGGIDHLFIKQLIEMMRSDDPRERDYLRCIVQRIYSRIIELRGFIRRTIMHRFMCVIYEGDTCNGVSELLEILGNIISGFGLPLKEEHKVFLDKALLPLSKVSGLSLFSRQLEDCITQFLAKDTSLASMVIFSLIRWWPMSMSTKQVAYLNQLEVALDMMEEEEFPRVKLAVFHRLGRCIESPHYLVCERALRIWNRERVVDLFRGSYREALPLLMHGLFKTRDHWNATIYPQAFKVLEALRECDRTFFDEETKMHQSSLTREAEEEEERQRRWAILQQLFDKNKPKQPCIPLLEALSPRRGKGLFAAAGESMQKTAKRATSMTKQAPSSANKQKVDSFSV